MRITNSMLAENTLKNINKAANRMADAGERESSQQKIQSASDDPVTATRAVAYRSYVSQIKQYQDNADAASGWQKATDTALSDLTDVLQSMRELTNQAATDTVNEDDRLDIKADVETLQEQAISIMNRTYAGRYIFGGYSTQEAPYELKETDIGDTVTFKGNYLSLCGVVSADIDDADIISFYNSNKTSVSGSLAVAASAAVTQATTAAAAAAADPTDAVLAAKSVAAQATSTTLAAAVTTYGSATTVADAAAVAQTDYETAKSAAAADPSDTALAAAASAAKNLYDVLTDTITGSEQNIEYHIGFSEVTTVNAEGQDVSGEGTGNNMFDTFAKLLLALNGDTSYKTASLDGAGNVTVTTNALDISSLLSDIDTDSNRALVAQSALGARMKQVTNVTSILGEAYTAYKSLMSNNEDVDTAQAITELSTSEYCYQSSLAVGVKVISKTMIDYIA